MATTTPEAALAGLWHAAGLDPAALGMARLGGAEPALPSTYAMGTAAQASIAATGLAAAEIWRRRTGRAQEVAVEMREAAIDFRSERYLRLDGGEPKGGRWDAIAGPYRCGDGRWVRLHTNFPHHRDGVLRLLGCEYSREAVQRALDNWQAVAFETAAAEAGLCVTATRTTEEWLSEPQGQAAASLPPVLVERIGDAPPRALPQGDRPLGGLRVLDLTRVIAGPVCGRTLAAHGADVLHVSGPDLPNFDDLLPDTGRGKRAAAIELRDAAGRDTLRALVREADVFVQGYRPGAIAGHGFAPEALASRAPGIVCVSLSAYGHLGPWSGRRGFDSLVQNANGMNLAEAAAAGVEGPKPLPCQALDHASGYLLALGTMAALLHRAEEGGSWLVRVALAGTGEWIRGLGRLPDGLKAAEPSAPEIAAHLEESESGFGRMEAVRHAAHLTETPARWTLGAPRLGSSPPAW